MDLQCICMTLMSIISITFAYINSEDNKKICPTIVIKNTPKHPWSQLSDCSRINGSLRIVLIENERTERLDNISFPLLEEITDYLLIYRVLSVTTLENWFPNLQYIRGGTLLDGNALIVKDVPNLRHLGFHNLKHIRGGVRLENVNNLCFAQTSDYRIITEAIKPSSAQNKSRQLLTGFKLSAKTPFELNVKWNYTTSIKNISIDYYSLKLFEFEELHFYSKTFVKYNSRGMCSPTKDNKTAIGDLSDEHFVCSDAKQDDKSVQNCRNRFIFNTIEHEVDRDDCSSSSDKLLEHFIHPLVYKSNKSPDNESQSSGNDIENKRMPFDTEYYHIYKESNWTHSNTNMINNTTALKLGRLKHFQYYYVIVYACSHSSSCFVVAHNKTRTPPFEKGDEIIEESINYEVNNTKIFIYWSEPTKPNGAIISYQIHLHEVLNKTNKKTICLNRIKHKKINGYVIEDLDPQKEYSFKLRAVSMNGPSQKWTKDYYFNTTNCGIFDKSPDSSPIVYMTIGLTALLVAFVMTASICYLKAPKKHNSQIDIVSVNPEYEKFIVDPQWEVPKAHIDMFHVLGDGAFGRVYYGELRMNGKITKCAIKTLNPNPRTQLYLKERVNFLKEANTMKSFVECHHIVKLIGIVSIENPVLVLMEFMVNGDLKTYLRSNRPDNDENPNPRVPTWNRIFQMAIEISDGMAYLSARKFVHRDLAARNCMVAEDLTVKIGDFGMTRDIYDNDYYRKRDCGLIPVRWMSPEALRDGVFTSYSDIWAYGVVLWEMITMGAQPYQGYSNESVFQSVIRGVRLTQPDNCPKKLWKIMQFCWRKNPRTRPSFNEITEFLLPLANQSFRENCYYLNRTPFEVKQQSLKKIWYSLIPSNRLLSNDLKQQEMDNSDDFQYCQMKPQIHPKIALKEFNEQNIQMLNQLNEITTKILDEKSNALIDEQEITNQTKLIQC